MVSRQTAKATTTTCLYDFLCLNRDHVDFDLLHLEVILFDGGLQMASQLPVDGAASSWPVRCRDSLSWP